MTMGGSPQLDTHRHVHRTQQSSLQVDPSPSIPPSTFQITPDLISEPRPSVSATRTALPVSTNTTDTTSPNTQSLSSISELPIDATRRSPYSFGASRDQQFEHTPKTIKGSEGRSQREAKMSASGMHRDTRDKTLGSQRPTTGIVGQKRTAAGVIKPPTGSTRRDTRVPESGGSERRRSRSIGSLSHGSRIAALSVHLRTRLSYAAAKVEKSRKSHDAQAQLPPGFLTQESGSLSPKVEESSHAGHLASPFGGIGQRVMDLGSPNGTTASAPDPTNLSSLNGIARASPVARSENLSPFSLNGDALKAHHSLASSSGPKLAPSADIVSSTAARRRRPNPNAPPYAPIHRHRRHHSQQEFGVSRPAAHSETVLVSGTPPFGPSAYNSTSYNGISSQQSQSQNTSMEQDAIETLLFMSSPGHSGYHSNSQNSQTKLNHVRSNIAAAMDAAPGASWIQNSQSDTKSSQSSNIRGRANGLEAHAGDEIDRLLDQMDSDSEDERGFSTSVMKASSVPVESSQDNFSR